MSLAISKSFIVFLSSIQESESLESLDLSCNYLDDDSGAYISCLIESSYPLLSLNLNYNRFKDFSFALPLSKNKSLVSFEISHNPLEYMNLMSMLEMLAVNKTLQHIGLAGMASNAPAPIKENHSGFLNINESLTIKLANILRYSNISSINIDLDPTCLMQLKDLEISMTKHNQTLTKLTSALINWNNLNPTLANINKALKANTWLNDRTQEIPSDLEDLISCKLEKDQENIKSLKTPQKPLRRNDSFGSKNSETTIIQNKNTKLLSFNNSSKSSSLKQELSPVKIFQTISQKMSNFEKNFNNYSIKTDSFIEKLEQQLSSSNRVNLTSITNSIQQIQNKLEKLEAEKSANNSVVNEYIKKLESLKLKQPSVPSSKRSSTRVLSCQRQEKSFGDTFDRSKDLEDTEGPNNPNALKGKIEKLEKKIKRLENDSEKMSKFDQKLRSTIV